jgi:SNF2 family DNA or RNA helicase
MEHSHLKLDIGEPIIVFTPFKQAVPYIIKAFEEEYRSDIHIYSITGGLTAEQFGTAWHGFQNDTKGRRVLICVIKSAASFQATAACTEYFLGCEWDFNLNEQGEDRAYRIGQKNFVNVYYIKYKDTVDAHVLQRLNEKRQASDWVVGSDTQYVQLLQKLRGEN